MAAPEWPAWPFLLGAVLLVVFGVVSFQQGNVFFGILVMAVALAVGAVGVRQGRRAMAGSVEPHDASAPEPAATTVKEGGTALSAYYENEDAVRSMQKESRRLCKTCGSPVLEKASECPTCGSAP